MSEGWRWLRHPYFQRCKKAVLKKSSGCPAFDKTFDSFFKRFHEKIHLLVGSRNDSILNSVFGRREDGKPFFPNLKRQRTKEVTLMTLWFFLTFPSDTDRNYSEPSTSGREIQFRSIYRNISNNSLTCVQAVDLWECSQADRRAAAISTIISQDQRKPQATSACWITARHAKVPVGYQAAVKHSDSFNM